MYGIVNRAIRDLLVNEYGEETWQEVCRRAEYSGEVFVGMQAYDDELTYRLVGASAEVLEISAEEVLKAFGRSWVEYTAQEGYGDLVRLAGSSTAEVLKNVDVLHSRVSLQYPELRAPSFQVTNHEGETLRLLYSSDRDGLSAMVVGLVEGLGQLFGEEVEVRLERPRAAASDCDEFVVNIRKNTDGS